MTCTCSLLFVCRFLLTNFLTDFAAVLPEDVTEDQVENSFRILLEKTNFYFINLNLQDQEDFAASKLKSAVHAFLDKNGKVVNCLQFHTHLDYLLLQQEGDDANSLVIEKDNITGEIVSQVEKAYLRRVP